MCIDYVNVMLTRYKYANVHKPVRASNVCLGIKAMQIKRYKMLAQTQLGDMSSVTCTMRDWQSL